MLQPNLPTRFRPPPSSCNAPNWKFNFYSTPSFSEPYVYNLLVFTEDYSPA